MRAAIYVHGHPDVRPGGSEVAAYSLFQGLHGEIEDRLFAAAVGGRPMKPGFGLQTFSADSREFVFPDLVTERFFIKSGQQQALKDFAQLLRDRRMDLIHFHHFLGIGVDGVMMLRRLLPEVAFVFTAHEYLSICARDGQMMMPCDFNHKRCSAPAPGRCAICMPDHAAHEFDVRLGVFQAMFECFDAIISPSRFLADTIRPYVGGRTIEVIENCTPDSGGFVRSPGPSSNDVSTFGFFGQINTPKGVDVFLDAAELFAERNGKGAARFLVHGAIAMSDIASRERIEQRLSSGVVRYMGPYDSQSVFDLMSGVDWVVVPSIWWENAPVVIEEALAAGRPIICSDIGGMAEKVPPTSGLHFRVGSARDLCRTFEMSRGNTAQWNAITGSLRRPEQRRATVLKHIEIYNRVLGLKSRPATAGEDMTGSEPAPARTNGQII
jgi:glycosyltransferase involved in cell wall biosynthesis